jgi:hypothetical protein
LKFLAELGRITQNRCVDVPARVSSALGKGKVPVRASVLGIEFESTLAPRGSGLHRLFIPSQVWRTLGVDVGDRILVEMEKAPRRPAAKIPPELLEAAAGDPLVPAEYSRLSPADRRQIARRLDSLRSPEARRRLLCRIAALLAARAASRSN